MLIAKCIHLGRSLLLVKASGNKFSFNCPIRKWKNVDLIEGQQSGSVRTNLKSDWLKKTVPLRIHFMPYGCLAIGSECTPKSNGIVSTWPATPTAIENGYLDDHVSLLSP